MDVDPLGFPKIKGQNIRSLIASAAVVLVSVLVIFTSAITLGLFNFARLSVFYPETADFWNTAINLVNTSNGWALANEVFRCILMICFLKVAVRVLDGKPAPIGELGIHPRVREFPLLLVGVLLMSIIFWSALLMDVGQDALIGRFKLTFAQNGLVLLILIAFANGLWQELAFRGFLQKRLTRTYGPAIGIFLCALFFTLLHGLVREIGVVEVILGTMLFSLVGVLFLVTDSIVICTAVHATGNFYLRSFGANDLDVPAQESRLLTFGVGLLIVLLVVGRRLTLPGTKDQNEQDV